MASSRDFFNLDGTPCAVKVACTVWGGGKPGDNIKGLPITIFGIQIHIIMQYIVQMMPQYVFVVVDVLPIVMKKNALVVVDVLLMTILVVVEVVALLMETNASAVVDVLLIITKKNALVVAVALPIIMKKNVLVAVDVLLIAILALVVVGVLLMETNALVVVGVLLMDTNAFVVVDVLLIVMKNALVAVDVLLIITKNYASVVVDVLPIITKKNANVVVDVLLMDLKCLVVNVVADALRMVTGNNQNIKQLIGNFKKEWYPLYNEEIQLGWTRLQQDIPTYDDSLRQVGILRRTYGIKILDIGEMFIKVFSPDLNKNVLLLREDFEQQSKGQKGSDKHVHQRAIKCNVQYHCIS